MLKKKLHASCSVLLPDMTKDKGNSASIIQFSMIHTGQKTQYVESILISLCKVFNSLV